MQVLDEIQVLWRYAVQEAMHGAERGECEAMLTVEQSNRFIIESSTRKEEVQIGSLQDWGTLSNPFPSSTPFMLCRPRR